MKRGVTRFRGILGDVFQELFSMYLHEESTRGNFKPYKSSISPNGMNQGVQDISQIGWNFLIVIYNSLKKGFLVNVHLLIEKYEVHLDKTYSYFYCVASLSVTLSLPRLNRPKECEVIEIREHCNSPFPPTRFLALPSSIGPLLL